MTTNQKRQETKGTDQEGIQILELLDLDFNITMLDVFKKMKGETKYMTETIFEEIERV